MGRRSKKWKYYNTVPEPNDKDWVPINGSRLWLPHQKSRSTNLKRPSINLDLDAFGPGWILARTALHVILSYTLDEKTKFQIEWVKKVGEGLSKEVYRADVSLLDDDQTHLVFAVSLLLNDADEDAGQSMVKEFELLELINKTNPSFLVPEPIGIVWNSGTLVSVRKFVFGLPVELRAPRSFYKHPWELVAKLAAEIHNLKIGKVPIQKKHYLTRHEHIYSEIAKYERYNTTEVRTALNWINENLPKNEKSSFLHSDLLGQNIYQTDDESVHVLDWEYSFFGDPAYDLAIVTRGVKNPFQTSGGLDLFIESYRSFGGKDVTKQAVYIFEMFLVLGWFAYSLDETVGGHGPEYYLQHLTRLIQRAERYATK